MRVEGARAEQRTLGTQRRVTRGRPLKNDLFGGAEFILSAGEAFTQFMGAPAKWFVDTNPIKDLVQPLQFPNGFPVNTAEYFDQLNTERLAASR